MLSRSVVLQCPICGEGSDNIELNDSMEYYSFRCTKCRKDIDFDVKTYMSNYKAWKEKNNEREY